MDSTSANETFAVLSVLSPSSGGTQHFCQEKAAFSATQKYGEVLVPHGGNADIKDHIQAAIISSITIYKEREAAPLGTTSVGG